MAYRLNDPCPPLPPGYRVLRVGEIFHGRTDLYAPGNEWKIYPDKHMEIRVIRSQLWTCTPDFSNMPCENDT